MTNPDLVPQGSIPQVLAEGQSACDVLQRAILYLATPERDRDRVEFILRDCQIARTRLLTALRSLPPQKEEKEQGALTRMDTPKVTSDDSRTAPTSDPTRTGQRGIARLAGLSDGWHREGAYICPRISDAAITRATHVQAMLAEMWAVPMPDGGVQLECHGHGFDLEVTIDPAGDVYDASADLAQAIEGEQYS